MNSALQTHRSDYLLPVITVPMDSTTTTLQKITDQFCIYSSAAV